MLLLHERFLQKSLVGPYSRSIIQRNHSNSFQASYSVSWCVRRSPRVAMLRRLLLRRAPRQQHACHFPSHRQTSVYENAMAYKYKRDQRQGFHIVSSMLLRFHYILWLPEAHASEGNSALPCSALPPYHLWQ